MPSKEETSQNETYFKSYKIKENDLVELGEGINILYKSGLVNPKIIKNIQFVTYDSEHFYVFTTGSYKSKENIEVNKIKSTNKSFKIFKIKNPKNLGRSKNDYRGARAWLLSSEIEETADRIEKFPNENILYEPEKLQPKMILDIISIPPVEPYKKIQKNKFNYLTDLIFHEAGHIEHRRLRNWKGKDSSKHTFPSDEQKNKFLSLINSSNILPKKITNTLIKNINKNSISELYTIMIDHEAAKRYDAHRHRVNNKNIEINSLIKEINANQKKEKRGRMDDKYIYAKLLLKILEKSFPNFDKRKEFMNSILSQKNNK